MLVGDLGFGKLHDEQGQSKDEGLESKGEGSEDDLALPGMGRDSGTTGSRSQLPPHPGEGQEQGERCNQGRFVAADLDGGVLVFCIVPAESGKHSQNHDQVRPGGEKQLGVLHGYKTSFPAAASASRMGARLGSRMEVSRGG